MYDVLIIGAGVVGGMLARELSRYHLSVCLLEKENDVAMGATRANSGIIHGGYDPEPGTLKAQLNTQGVPLLYEAARQLNVHHQNNGSLVCAFGAEEEKELAKLLERGLINGISGLSILTGDEARKLEPQLSPEVTGALHVPTAGIICPYELTIAAVGNAMDNGVELLRNFAVESIAHGDVFIVNAKDGRSVTGTHLVNCAGGWADKVAALMDDAFFTITPRSGEYMLLDKAEGSRVRHTIFQVPSELGKGILVSPTVDGNLLTGPTATHVAAPNDTQTTAEGLDAVARLAARSVPGTNFRQVITSFTGVRASTPGGDFILQASDKVPHLFHAAAIDSPGLTCCVAIAKYLVDLLAKDGLALEEKTDWDGTRPNTRAFREMSDEDKDAYIKANPDYGKIVCRCETVSEGEMRDAIRRNPPALDLDGVKRRTRGGMGRCQGGFCSPYVMKLIAQEHGIPMEQVTKSGGASRPLTGKL
ncbi:MAG: NAD(P)/FAD-dependent oxidoreductase [Oscillospiraceae bacterium]|nr:NAD(P)/FAD-dependent oxidoreductase [Oscillospiraceae bacterium]